MAWEQREEWVDLATSKHVVVFHNRDVLVDYGRGKKEPQEHHLIYDFRPWGVAEGGAMKGADAVPERLDFEQVKKDTLEALKAHHKLSMQHREKHPSAPIKSVALKR